ncbi:MBOAT family O-acyltransferase [Dyadobacter aurulentus]|uniref:MBOAT family O-acyltransferase n=1 Tax=Dyadobacter sp. UC 10 TaxID=2605428 RepID=UPI0011F1A5D4|nr:MBOAT family O-acyltransferase [Dyadobacter sp. UC 10]KAA0989881.1 MBOAT family protein [Dyadobacter sp. UC 10]
MLFNSIHFALFLPIVFFIHWFIAKENLKLQNIVLLFASYFFYSCWDWRFMLLLVFSTLLDYFTGIKIHEASNHKSKKFWLWLSISINLGFLGIFKYYNFFADSFADGLALLGFRANFETLQIILPIGISFYTFHGLSYVIDIYKGRFEPERNFVPYSLFVSFFPLLVAGPIERGTHLLPQLTKARKFNSSKAIDGLRQILWGLFKKIVIADNCAEYANTIFNNSDAYSGSTLVVGALFFTFQIYCDFSGYSDIALGTARLFGIDLLRNFAFPYFSRDIAEFWRRWHISLSSWFKDYLYIPLGGSKGSTWMKVRNTFIIFLVSGFWHGANWTFIVWGVLNAIYILPSIIFNTNRNNLDIVAKGRLFPTLREFFAIISTFALTVLAWIFFRANNVSHAFNYIAEIFSTSLFTVPSFAGDKKSLVTTILLGLFVLIEWQGREEKYAIEKLGTTWIKPVRWGFYYSVVILIFLFTGENQTFIYFQF